MSDGVEIFVCHNSYSLACAEYLLRSRNIRNGVLIYASGVEPRAGDLNADLWMKIHVVKYSKHVLRNFQVLRCIYRKYAVVALYVSNFLDKAERLLLMQAKVPVIFIDDGVATIAIAHHGFKVLFHNSTGIDGWLKYIVYCGYAFVTGLTIPYPLRKVTRKIDRFITTFPVAIDDVLVQRIPYPFHLTGRVNGFLPVVYFLGQNMYSAPGVITHSDYYARVCYIMDYYRMLGLGFAYFPHPREYDIPCCIAEKAMIIDQGFERYLCEADDVLPRRVASFLSTSLPVAKSFGSSIEVDAWTLRPQCFGRFGYMYDFFSASGINVVAI